MAWIQQTTNTSPLVAVIGGYTKLKYSEEKGLEPKVEGGPDNDIEIISKDRKCRAGMKFADTGVKKVCDAACQKKSPDDPTLVPYTFSDADVLGHTGQFTNDAPIYCGGKSPKDNLEVCWEYDYTKNE